MERGTQYSSLSGSKRNWTSLHKAFHRALPYHSVHTLDLRNHGASPRATPMTYTAMAEDVLYYIDTHNLSNVALLGHSMFVNSHLFSIILEPPISDRIV